MATAFLIPESSRKKVTHDFKEFLLTEGVVSTAAGVIVGIATYQYVRNASFDVFMPFIDRALFGGIRFLHPPTGAFLSQIFKNVDFRWLKFIQETIAWLLVIFVAFVVLQYILGSQSIPMPFATKQGDSKQTQQDY